MAELLVGLAERDAALERRRARSRARRAGPPDTLPALTLRQLRIRLDRFAALAEEAVASGDTGQARNSLAAIGSLVRHLARFYPGFVRRRSSVDWALLASLAERYNNHRTPEKVWAFIATELPQARVGWGVRT